MSVSAPIPPSKSATQRTWRTSFQWQTLLLAGAAWSIWPTPSIPAILLSYIVGLGLANWLLPRLENATANDATHQAGSSGETRKAASRWWWVLIAIAPLVAGGKALWKLPMAEDWTSFRENITDRVYLESVPSIMPRLVASHQPQRFLIQSPGSKQVEVEWARGAAAQASIPLGDGLFLIDLDPRQVPEVGQVASDSLEVALIVDGRRHSRTLDLVHPQPHPRWFHSLPEEGLAVTVSEETDEVIVVRRDGSFRKFPVDDGPSDAVLLAGGKQIVVAHRFASDLWILDTQTGELVHKLNLGPCQNRLALSPDQRWLAVAMNSSSPGIQWVSTTGPNRGEFLELNFIPDWLQFGRDERELVVTDRRGKSVVRLEKSDALDGPRSTDPTNASPDGTNAEASAWQVLGEPIELARPVATMCRSVDGSAVWLASTAATTRAQPITANHFVENSIMQIDLATWRIRGVERTDRRSTRQDGAGDTELGISPLGLAPYEEGFIAAFAGSSEVAIALRGLESRLRFESTARHSIWAPHGVADLGQKVWCVSSPATGQIGVVRGEELLAKIELAASDDELTTRSPKELLRRRGELGFYESTRAGLACQSCHLHLGPDYSRHNIGQDVDSDSLTVRGVAGTSPYLRDGSNAGLRSLHEVTESVYRGYRRAVPWDRREALAAFLASLPAEVNPRQLEPLDSTRMRKGHAAFRKADCHQCHGAPAMTNLAQHPVRQLFPDYILDEGWFSDYQPFVDTPSLRGVSLHPPYLHDGRAANLVDVLREHNRADQHGRVSGLLPTEIDDLLYFLGQL
ncbi:MAG: hypothetical protein U1A77_15355 [Pirellulales bacterium]